MIKKTISISILLALCFFTGVSMQAQRVVQGEAAKITYIEGIQAEAFAISSNGKYIVGGAVPSLTNGYVYSVDSAKVVLYIPEGGTGIFTSVANTGKAVGQFFADHPASSLLTSGFYRNGRWDAMQPLPTGKDPIDPVNRKVSGAHISADGTVIGGFGYTNYYYKDEKGKFMHQGAVWSDTTLIKVLKPHYPYEGVDFSGYGCAAYNTSANGKVFMGVSAWPGSYTNNSPVIWIDDTSYSLADQDIQGGIVNGSNADGSILVGQVMLYGSGYRGAIWTNGVREIISSGTSREATNFIRVGDNGIVLCASGEIYTKELGFMSFGEFLSELYGLNAGMSPSDMSTDGRTFCGSGPSFVTLGEQTINTRPRAAVAKQEKGSLRVNVSWNLPYENGREILGYNVYRDSVKINTELVTERNFTDPESKVGIITYKITAVYATGESKMSNGATLDVIAADGCYSIKNLESFTEYNRKVTIQWQAPSDAVVRGSSIQAAGFENVTDTNIMDLVEMRPMGSNTIVVAQLGNKYYVGDWFYPRIGVYDLQWKSLGSIVIRNLPPTAALTSDGQNLYAVGKTAYMFKLNLEDKTIDEMIPIPTRGQHIAFIPTLDGGNGGFEVGDWSTSVLVKRDGTKISDGFTVKDCAGAVYYDGLVYTAQQVGTGLSQIIKYDATTKERVGEIFDLSTLPQVQAIGTSEDLSIGGLSVVRTFDSTLALTAIIQNSKGSNELMFFQLEPSPEILGFNLFRNDEKVNTDGLLTRHNYSEIIEEPGTYTYKVSAKFRNGCEATPTVTTAVEIYAISGCSPVKNLAGRETYGNVELRWEAPITNPQGALVGFNVYKDGELVTESLLKEFSYVDFLPTLGAHKYRVEAFFDNSCTASDSINVEVTGQGFCLPATNIVLTQARNGEDFDVTAKWDLPHFEDPLPLRYGNGQNAGVVGEPTGANFTVAAAWDSAQLKVYQGFKLVGMEIYTGDPAVITPLVMIDDSIVYQFDAGKVKLNSFTTIMFDRSIPFDNAWELAVGYTASFYSAGNKPVGSDAGPAVQRRGDLYTLDFKNWSSAAATIGVEGNWNITALLVKSREVETDAATIAAVKQGRREIYKVDVATGNLVAAKSPQITNAPSGDLKLTGFNIYRGDSKLNEAPIKETSYLDAKVPQGKHTYTVGSLWSTCDEMVSEGSSITVGTISIDDELNLANISVYPNPAKDYITISGDYTNLEILDLSGRKLAKHTQKVEKIDISSLKKGVYMLRIETKEAGTMIKKIVVQ